MTSDVCGARPVEYSALISTVDEDGSPTLSAVLPVRVFGLRATIVLDAGTRTAKNMIRTGECVLNLPSAERAAAVDRLARLAGTDRRAAPSLRRRYFSEDFWMARLTPVPSEAVSVPRALECPMQLEAMLTNNRRSNGAEHEKDEPLTIEVRILRVHLDPSIVLGDDTGRAEANEWKPLMACLREAYEPLPGGQVAELS